MVTLAAVGAEISLGRSTRDAPLPSPANLSDTAVLADGSLVAVTQRQTAEGWALYEQRFLADGAPLDPEPARVATGGAIGSPEVIALEGGGFVIAWTETASGAGPSRSQVAYSAYDAAGQLQRTEVLGRFDGAVSVAGAAAPGGGFTLGWAGAAGGSSPAFFTQTFGPDGAAAGSATAVSAAAAAIDPAIVPTGDGAYLALWGDHGRYFDGRGFGPELALERVTDAVWGGMDAVRLASGDIAVVWSEVKATGYLPNPEAQAFLQVFDPDTGSFGPRTLLTGASGFQLLPNVVALEDGGMAVTWRAGDGHAEVGLYGADGSARGAQAVQGDFVGVDHGQILSTRIDADGGFWLQRYAAGDGAGGFEPPVPDQPQPQPALTDAPATDPTAPNPTPPQDAPPPANVFQSRGPAADWADRSDSPDAVALIGSGEGDVLLSGSSADVIDAGAGDDEVHGGAGADRVRGGGGDDVFVFRVGDLVGAGGAVDHVIDFHAAGAAGEQDSLAFVGFGTGAQLAFHHYGVRGGVVDQRLQYYQLTDGDQAYMILVQVADGATGLGAADYAFYAA